jgi:hypothetical protein
MKIILAGTVGVMVDDNDYEFLSHFSWFWDDYPKTHLLDEEGNSRVTCMHNLLLQVPAGCEVDHWDRNTANSQRANLRVASKSQNRANSKEYKNNTSGWRGVREKNKGKFQVTISKDSEQIYVGTFGDDVSAAIAFNNAALSIHGVFASLNCLPFIIEPFKQKSKRCVQPTETFNNLI